MRGGRAVRPGSGQRSRAGRRLGTQADVLDPRMPFLAETPSQTAGPYLHIGATPGLAGLEGVYERDLGSTMRSDGAEGEAINLRGTIRDGTGALVRDALVECWQADANGRFAGSADTDPAFSGFGRSACDPQAGEWRFETVRPGRVAWTDGRLQAPHVSLWIVARGVNVGLHTRLYFEDDPANDEDPLLGAIQPPERARTMIARREGDAWRLDIRLQRGPAGEPETVFLDM